MFGKIAKGASLTIHTCSICGTSGRWGVNSIAFGSPADEDCGATVIMCDTKCAKKFQENPRKYYRPMKPRGYDYVRDSVNASDLDVIKSMKLVNNLEGGE